MEKLMNAGFEIIASEYTWEGPNGEKEGIALGHKVTQSGDEWVTWGFNEYDERKPEERSYYWGRYFGKKKFARIDYHERIVKALL